MVIYLTQKDKERTRILLNHRLFEKIAEGMETVIFLENGRKYIVDENAEEIIAKIVQFESRIFAAQQKGDCVPAGKLGK